MNREDHGHPDVHQGTRKQRRRRNFKRKCKTLAQAAAFAEQKRHQRRAGYLAHTVHRGQQTYVAGCIQGPQSAHFLHRKKGNHSKRNSKQQAAKGKAGQSRTPHADTDA